MSQVKQVKPEII